MWKKYIALYNYVAGGGGAPCGDGALGVGLRADQGKSGRDDYGRWFTPQIHC